LKHDGSIEAVSITTDSSVVLVVLFKLNEFGNQGFIRVFFDELLQWFYFRYALDYLLFLEELL